MKEAMLADRVAVVTGAGRGLGAAYARALAALGAAVVVNDAGFDLFGNNPDPSPANEVTREIVSSGGQAVADATDIASFTGAAELVRVAVARFGRLDIVVNNAGLIGSSAVEDIDEAEFRKIMDVHVTGTVGMIRAAMPLLKRQGWGRIINITSEAALSRQHGPGIAYSTAKAAVWGITMAGASDGIAHGVTVNAVSPGAATRMSESHLAATGIPAGLDLSPARVAEVLVTLCSDEAADITGRVVHTAAGHIREYKLTRTHDTELVSRLSRIRDTDAYKDI